MRNAKPRSGIRIGLLVALCVWAVALAATMTGTFGKPSKNPPGANGTIKIDRVPFDQHPDNQPHVGCIFQVDFYGFDQGNYNAAVTFTLQPPSGRRVVLTDTVFVGQDPAGGGTDLDAERTYDLNGLLAASEMHPQQGWHIKVDIEAPGNGQTAKKTKVFWVQDCKTRKDCPPPRY